VLLGYTLGDLRPGLALIHPDDRADLQDALSRTTVAVFPYRAELDQSGALLQALGAGVPAVVYDVGGLGEVVTRYGAGRVVAPGDVDALAAAIDGLLHGEYQGLVPGHGSELGETRRYQPGYDVRPIDWNVAATVGVVTIIPIFFFSLFIQRYIVRGITAGAVK